MASVNAKINGQFVKIPNYTSADADQIPYDESRNFREGYIGKEIKDLNSTVATHSQEIVNKADKDAYVETLEVGLADNLIDRKDIGSSEEIAYRTTHDKISVTEDGNADVQVIKGNTEKFNQLISYLPTFTKYGITVTLSEDGTYLSVSGTLTEAQPYGQFTITDRITLKRDNTKYLIAMTGNGDFSIGQCGYAPNSSSYIWQNNSETPWTNPFFIYIPNVGTTVNIPKLQLNVFDLTAMGLDTITTVADFRAIYPKPYYAYNAGQLINFNGTSLVTNGFNQLDAEGHIRVIGGKTYRIEGAYTSIKDSSNNDVTVTNNEFTPSVADTYTVVATTMPCIHFKWSGYRDGDTESYWSNTKSLDYVQTYFPNGMKSAGSAYDEINFKTHKAITRMIEITFDGSDDEGWELCDSVSARCKYGILPRLKLESPNSTVLNNFVASTGEATSHYASTYNNRNPTSVELRNIVSRWGVSEYTVEALQTRLQNKPVTFVIELETPTEVDIPTSLTCIYPCADFGTERLTPSTYDLLTSPMKAQIHYNLDYTRQIENNILVSGENIKTVNNQSLLGSGNINITGNVTSVNGQTGTVVLDADDIAYDTNNSVEDVLTAHFQEIVNLNKLGLYIDSNGNIIDIWED